MFKDGRICISLGRYFHFSNWRHLWGKMFTMNILISTSFIFLSSSIYIYIQYVIQFSTLVSPFSFIKTWSNQKPWGSLGICSAWGFQNTPLTLDVQSDVVLTAKINVKDNTLFSALLQNKMKLDLKQCKLFDLNFHSQNNIKLDM